MSLPTRDDMEKVLNERPGDELYPHLKPKVAEVDVEEKKIRSLLVDLILKDLIFDLGVANSMDEVGATLEYLAQERQIEPPEFSGDILMKNFSRISKLHLSLKYAEMIGLKGQALDLMIKAEVDRLWGDANSALLKQLLLNKAAAKTGISYPPQPIETGSKEIKKQE